MDTTASGSSVWTSCRLGFGRLEARKQHFVICRWAGTEGFIGCVCLGLEGSFTHSNYMEVGMRASAAIRVAFRTPIRSGQICGFATIHGAQNRVPNRQ